MGLLQINTAPAVSTTPDPTQKKHKVGITSRGVGTSWWWHDHAEAMQRAMMAMQI